MAEQPSPYQLYVQAVGEVGVQGGEAVSRRYHELMVEHGHLVPRPACTCDDPEGRARRQETLEPFEHLPGCPRYSDNDRRLPCGWLPGEQGRPA